ncbi:MAG: DUF4255 domain-containing protein [bacterium]
MNRYIKNIFWVIAYASPRIFGPVNLPAHNQDSTIKLCLSLINIHEEKILKSQPNHIARQNNQISHVNPELRLTLCILFAVNFPENNFKEGLGFLSDVIGFFQSKNVFTSENTPAIDSSIKKLIVNLYSLDFETQNHLWGILGSKYFPSVVYQLQTLFIQEHRVKDDQKRHCTRFLNFHHSLQLKLY